MKLFNNSFNPFKVLKNIEKLVICLFDAPGIFLLILFPLSLSAKVLLNEFMIDPENDNTGEFIEIYNAGDSCLDLRRFFICDAQDTDAVIAFPDSLIYPGQYGLILDPDYTGEYNDLLQDSIPIFTIPDSRFGKYGISNSTSKQFSLLSADHTISDSYSTGYPLWPDPGYSIERIRFNDTLWAKSQEIHGTPGFRNSNAAKPFDLAIINLNCSIPDSVIHISFSIVNTGLQTLNEISIGYIMDISIDSANLNDTLISSTSAPLIAGDSSTFYFEYFPNHKGHVLIHAFALTVDDVGDTLSQTIFIPLHENELIVTEFVCKTGSNFNSEYIEILSLSNKHIQLFGLEVHDMTGYTIIDSCYVLSPDSMIVLAQSASFHDDFPFVENYILPPAWRSLNNSEDLICLQNPTGSSIFNLQYNVVWDIPSDCAMQLVDTALNYNDPHNWEMSYEGSPGKFNVTKKQLKHLSFHLEKDFYTPLDTLKFLIINDGFFPIEEGSCLCATPISEHIIYIPFSKPGDTIPCEVDTTGIFIEGTNTCTLGLNSIHEYRSETYHFKYYFPFSNTPLFFNEVLFDPIDTHGQSEFIELECTQNPLDLKNWKIRVNNSTCELGDSLSNTYTAICDIDDPIDGIISSARRTFSRFPSLPNAGAELFLLDPLDRIIDHVDLRDHSGIKEGKSIEKQFRSISSDDRSLWSSSVSSTGMSPGRLNSIASLPGMRNDLDIYPEVFDPNINDLIQFSIDSEVGIEFCEIACFNLAGQMIYKHEQNVFSNPSFLHYWDGKIDSGEFPARGLYLVITILHQISGETQKLQGTFVIK